MDRIPNDKLREAFQRSHMKPYEVSRAVGYTRKRRSRSKESDDGLSFEMADSTLLLRRLGMKPVKSPNGQHYLNKRIAVKDALLISQVLGVDPHEAGL